MVCTWLYVSIATHPLCNKLHLGARHLEEYHTSLSAGTSIVCMLCLPTMHTNCDPVQVLLHCIGHLAAKTLLESCVLLGVQALTSSVCISYLTLHTHCRLARTHATLNSIGRKKLLICVKIIIKINIVKISVCGNQLCTPMTMAVVSMT